METVETVEIILENGECYEFASDKCSVVLGDITEKVSNLGGRIFKTKVASNVNIIIDVEKFEAEDVDIAGQLNILEVVLHNHLGDYEKYLVKWGEVDIDENSLQSHYYDELDNLVISIG